MVRSSRFPAVNFFWRWIQWQAWSIGSQRYRRGRYVTGGHCVRLQSEFGDNV